MLNSSTLILALAASVRPLWVLVSTSVQCLRLMDEINEIGDTLIVTKHGKPVAVVGPAYRDRGGLWGFMEGTTCILGDIDSPAIPAVEWGMV